MDEDKTPAPPSSTTATGAGINGATPIEVSSDDDEPGANSDATKWKCDQCQLLNPIQVLTNIKGAAQNIFRCL